MLDNRLALSTASPRLHAGADAFCGWMNRIRYSFIKRSPEIPLRKRSSPSSREKNLADSLIAAEQGFLKKLSENEITALFE